MRPACRICKGTAGPLSPRGTHYLCEARARQGKPAQSPGDACPDCDGLGQTKRTMIEVSVAPWLGLTEPCQTCNGLGIKPGTRRAR